MISATTVDSQSVTYTYEIENSSLDTPLDIAFYRSAKNHFDPTHDIKIGDQILTGADLGPGTHTETAKLAGGLPIDPAHPFVLAVADPQDVIAGSEDPKDTHDTASFRTFIIGAVAHGFELTPGFPPWVGTMANSLKKDGYDATIAFDWSATSGLPAPGMTVLAGQSLADAIATTVMQLPQLGPGDVIDLHLIGHSRGAVVISQAALDLEAMEQKGILPQLRAGYLKMTFLDPHPAHNLHSFGNPTQTWFSASPGPLGRLGFLLYTQFQAAAHDPEVVVPNNAADAEVYYQHTPYRQTFSPDENLLVNFSEKFFINWGEVPVLGENRMPLRGGAVVHYYDLTQIVHGHYEVHDWYQQNVVPILGTATPFVSPGNTALPSPTQGRGRIPVRPSAAGLAYEVHVLSPAIFDRPGIALIFERQLAAAEMAFARGHLEAAVGRLTFLVRFLQAQRRHVSPAATAVLSGLISPFLGGTPIAKSTPP